VLEAVKRLSSVAEVVCGGDVPSSVLGADPEKGAFMAPTLLRSHESSPSVHQIEAFGPVATVIDYRNLEDAIALLNQGDGSLVASLVSHDADVVRKVVLGVAPYHGRILILDRDCSSESTGHGTPMPQLIHGGPGRAGGGEEEGGLRAVIHYLQRSAVQGSPAVLNSLA
jgi:oxepin-CoA hydrolase/3-oxo-5,6-dehydrosuberyl-CoA semialdehyde dehydrogenase